MVVLSDLPNELIIGIWGYVIEPEDVESFALVSKRVYGLAKPFVEEHTRLKQEYSQICCYIEETGNGDLLEKMLLNPRITLYIKELQIDTCAEGWIHQSYLPWSCSGYTMELFKEAMRSSFFIDPSERGAWAADIELGDADPVIALIIMRLTKLKKLELFRVCSDDHRYLSEILGRITQPPKEAIYPELLTVDSDRGPLVSASLESLEAVARLLPTKKPHVWHHVSTGSEIENDSHVDSPRPSILSNVSDLVISFWDIEFDELSRLLLSIRELKSFNYSGIISSSFEPSQVCNDLLECSQHSLQKLCLHYDENFDARQNPSHVGDITRFSTLAEVETDFVLLLGSENDTCRRFPDTLPMSIERVTLWSSEDIFTLEVLRTVVLQMVQSKMKRLPNLKALKLILSQSDRSRYPELITGLEGISAEVGVLLSIKVY